MSREGSKARTPSPAPPTPPSPVFWFGFELPWLKVGLVRALLFSVLAIDAFLQIPHAPRHAAGFNVAHLSILDGLAPGRVGFVVAHLTMAYLFALIAIGIAPRVLVPIGAALYAWVYFTSQLDSYQHHYLVALVLLLACFVPWTPPPGSRRSADVRSWALRLILVQLGVMYLWAAIAKMHGAWLDGTALAQQLRVAWMRDAIAGLPGGWATASVLVLGAELFLAVGVWWRRLWPVATPLAIAFHLGIEQSGLEIGLFSYVMVGLWLLAVPDRWFLPLARPVGDALDRLTARRLRGDALSWALLGAALLVAVIAGVAMGAAVRVPIAGPVAIALGAAVVVAWIAASVRSRRPRIGRRLALSVAHLAAIALWLVLDRVTDVAVDYHRFWGGSARRLGRLGEARAAYTELLRIDPDSGNGHYQLGRIAEKDGKDDEALERYRAAQRLEPRRARAFLGEAGILQRRGERETALDRARAGLAAEPRSADARRVVDAMSRGSAAAPDPDPDAP